MIVYSEKTKKEYKTVDECLAAEHEFDEKQAKKEEEKKALAAKRAARAKEVEDAYKEALEARKIADEKLNSFCKDYGSFHMTLATGESNPFNLFDSLFSSWF